MTISILALEEKLNGKILLLRFFFVGYIILGVKQLIIYPIILDGVNFFVSYNLNQHSILLATLTSLWFSP